MVEPRIVCRVDHPGFPDWKLPFYPRSTGINVFRGRGLAESLPPLEVVELCWVAQGGCEISCDGRMETVRAGESLFRLPGEYRRKRCPDAVETVVCWATFDGEGAAPFLEGYGYPRRARRSGEGPVYLFDEIAGLFAVQSPFSMRRLVSLYAELIARMGEGENDATEAGRLVNECVRLIHAGYADPAFNVNRMAAELRVHRTTLDRVFRQKIRLSPIDYLIRFRLQRGLSLLAETSLPVAEVAARVGISQSGYFSRLIRRTVGMTPSEYRLARNL